MSRIGLRNMLNSNRWRFAPPALQSDYYRRTASAYDSSHVDENDVHTEALAYIVGFLRQIGAESVLDVGCGTGRGIRYLRELLPGVRVEGNDPSADLLRIAHERHDIPDHLLHHGDTASLGFQSGSFDAVMSLGVLHHVATPDELVGQMVDLAAKALFISDCNYMGQGSLAARALKMALTRFQVWPMVKYAAQGFKGWSYSEGDGVFYSYSIFNDLHLVERAFRRVFVIPLGAEAGAGRRFPVLCAPSVLIVALR